MQLIELSIPLNREQVDKDKEYLYLFTDNAARTSGYNPIGPGWYTDKYGKGLNYPRVTQAVIRGLHNAYPITTMVNNRGTQWEDKNFQTYKNIIDNEILTITIAVTDYKGIKYNAVPPYAAGFGISNMRKYAPLCWAYLNYKLMEIGINNTKTFTL